MSRPRVPFVSILTGQASAEDGAPVHGLGGRRADDNRGAAAGRGGRGGARGEARGGGESECHFFAGEKKKKEKEPRERERERESRGSGVVTRVSWRDREKESLRPLPPPLFFPPFRPSPPFLPECLGSAVSLEGIDSEVRGAERDFTGRGKETGPFKKRGGGGRRVFFLQGSVALSLHSLFALFFFRPPSILIPRGRKDSPLPPPLFLSHARLFLPIRSERARFPRRQEEKRKREREKRDCQPQS